LFLVSEISKLKPTRLQISQNYKKQIHKKEEVQAAPQTGDEHEETKEYDPVKRDPQFAQASTSSMWELVELSHHFHPSVAKFASLLLQAKPISYDGDPLQDFSQTAFLERFIYKNPKKKSQEHGHSLMQPKYVRKSLIEQPVNATSFLQKAEQNIPEDQLFFYKYFKQQEESGKKKPKKEQKEDLFEEEDVDEIQEKGGSGEELDMEQDEPIASDEEFSYDKLDVESGEGEQESDEEDENLEDLKSQMLIDSEDSDINDLDGETGGTGDSFANIEDFAHLLEETADDPMNHNKQIAWEDRGQRRSNKRRSNSTGSNHRPPLAKKKKRNK